MGIFGAGESMECFVEMGMDVCRGDEGGWCFFFYYFLRGWKRCGMFGCVFHVFCLLPQRESENSCLSLSLSLHLWVQATLLTLRK